MKNIYIHSIDKELVDGVAVISDRNSIQLQMKMRIVLELVHCQFHGIFSSHFKVNNGWDRNYFHIPTGDMHYLISALRQVNSDVNNCHKATLCLNKLSQNPHPEKTYFISWS